MAGRGCTITIKFLCGSANHGLVEDISLPVALHSPLMVLKEQLHMLVSIAPNDQVLILCDLEDPERNSDILLIGRDNLSLRDCGIEHGSILTLHALGMSAESQQKLLSAAFDSPVDPLDDDSPSRTLDTVITAAEANHSYNGVIFDVESCGPFEVDLLSLSVAGMLGRVRIFARDRRWEDDQPERQSNHWWAHQDSVSTEGWYLIADVSCRPSWDKPLEIKFDKRVKLLPHQRKALYCHSSLPDDLGIQYQSYRKSDIVASDEFIALHPGLGHTGSEPFDDQQGWYRSYRGPAGSIRYYAKWKGWSPFEHAIFPLPLKSAVMTMLLCHNRQLQSTVGAEGAITSNILYTISSLPRYLIYYILEFMHFDWYIECTQDNDPASQELNDDNFIDTKRHAAIRFLSAVSGQVGGNVHLGQLFSYLSQNTIEFEGENLALTDLLGAFHGSQDDDDNEHDDDDECDDDDNVYEEVDYQDDSDEEDDDDEDALYCWAEELSQIEEGGDKPEDDSDSDYS